MMEWMYSVNSLKKQMEEEAHVYFIAYEECEPCGYVLPSFQGHHIGKKLFQTAIDYIKEVHPEPCRMELNVNRNNKALQFYEHLGMIKVREGDFPIGNGYYMNDYIMGMDIK